MSDSSSTGSERPTQATRRTPKKRVQKFVKNKRAKFDVESDSDAETERSVRTFRQKTDAATKETGNDVTAKEGFLFYQQFIFEFR